MGFAWLVHAFERPFLFALVYSGLSAVFALVTGAGVMTASVLFGITVIFCSIYFYLLDRFSDTLVTWLAILFGGALLWFGWPLFFRMA